MPTSERELVCILGLPIDVITMAEAVDKVRHAALTRQRCFISTPNLNFLMNAQKDESFRESVLRSDLSLADGVSLLAVARLMGVKLPERISGADLFAELCNSEEYPPIKVFFLGGPLGAAKLAQDRVNQQAKGVTCVGYDEAGFGDIESLSSQALIDRINATHPDFVVVSLGAQKGQAWIMRNHERLTAPVISHLGAVVNFTAGTVKRAPKWMQHAGMEWIWRAMTEPGLSKRYWDDGRALLSVLFKEAFHAAALERRTRKRQQSPAAVLQESNSTLGVRSLSLSGYWSRRTSEKLQHALRADDQGIQSIEINAEAVEWLDPYAIGALARAHGQIRARGGDGLKIKGLPSNVQLQLERNVAKYLMSA